jgi:hypothetical protein
MQLKECTTRRVDAAAELVQHENCEDGVTVTESLSDGLTTLRNLLYKRLHDDVERNVGADSMIMPVSDLRAEASTKIEIEIYQIAVSACHAQENRYISNAQWYLEWLTRLRLGDNASHLRVHSRLGEYGELAPAERRLHFTDVLVKSLRETGRAPLVLFRLFPLAVRIATSVAFGDHFAAAEVRNTQVEVLPALVDCHDCHGRPLENGEICKMCGNPVWAHRWLTAVD